MTPLPLYLGAGGIALLLSIHLLLAGLRKGTSRLWIGGLLWAVFSAGLLLHGFHPPLRVKNNAFVIPAVLTERSRSFNPADIIAAERRIRLLVGLLTFGGAVGLAIHYRRELLPGPYRTENSSATTPSRLEA